MSLVDRKTKLRARRLMRRQKRQVEAATTEADEQINRFFLRRFGRLANVRRFVFLWTALVLLLGLGAFWQVRGLDSYYLTNAAISGGIYREGIIGSFTNANPIYAVSSVDSSVSRLLFSGLFSVSPNGDLQGDLAESLEVDERGKVYTVQLRQGVVWSDGEPFDADDVIYTYKTIQNPDARSPLIGSWRGVELEKNDQYKVTFTLPDALSSFRYSLINGIVPEHVLSEFEPEELRSSSFNTVEPVGTGPFTLRTLEVVGDDINVRQERIAFVRNNEHHRGASKIDSVVLQTYRDEESMEADFDEQFIQSMVGLTSVPDNIANEDDVAIIRRPLTSSVMIFMNNSNQFLSDVAVRKALTQATNSTELRENLGFEAVASDSPFLRNSFAYNPETVQLPYDVAAANAALEGAGWTLNEDGIREKDGQTLSLRLVSQSLSEYAAIAQKLQEEWLEVGVEVEAVLQPEEDIQSGAIARHEYDVLLYGISVGYDPDVYAYWHSTQGDAAAPLRLNLSEFSDTTADEALEAGRTRVDEELRRVKYKPFLEAWRDNAPAIALYQPNFIMVVRGTFEGFADGQFSTATDRFYSINDWQIRSDQVVKPM